MSKRIIFTTFEHGEPGGEPLDDYLIEEHAQLFADLLQEEVFVYKYSPHHAVVSESQLPNQTVRYTVQPLLIQTLDQIREKVLEHKAKYMGEDDEPGI